MKARSPYQEELRAMSSSSTRSPSAKSSRNCRDHERRARSRRIRESVNTQVGRFLGGFQGLEVVSRDFGLYETANVSD
jgi:hypothetical protein